MFTFLDYYRMKPALLPEGVEVIRGQTPAGGAYAVVLYLDSAGRKTAKEKATQAAAGFSPVLLPRRAQKPGIFP